jgi:hypothetical protein
MRTIRFDRYCFILGIFLILHSPARAQQVDRPVEFDFYASGKYKLPAPDYIKCKDVRINIDNDKDPGHPYRYDFKFDPATNKFKQVDSLTPLQYLSADDLQKINKQLAARMTLALNNLADSDKLSELAMQFWGKDRYTTLTTNLKRLAKELDGGPFDPVNCEAQYEDFPGVCRLEQQLNSGFRPYVVSLRLDTDSSRYAVYISKTDWFHECLRNYWQSALQESGFDDQQLDHGYKTAWKNLETVANKLVTFHSLVTAIDTLLCDMPDNLDSVIEAVKQYDEDTLSHLADQPIYKLIKGKNALYQATFWYNYGFFGINPLGYTTPDRRYKVFMYQSEAARLHDKIIKDKLDKAATCCNLSINGIDSLIRSMHGGKLIFSTDTTLIDPVWGYNDLNTLRSSYKMIDQYQAPVTLHRWGPQILLQFDASQHYHAGKHNSRYKSVATTDSVNFVLFNIPNGTFISLPQTIQPTTNTSGLQDAFNSLSSVSGLITSVGQLSLTPFNASSQITPVFGYPAPPAQPNTNHVKSLQGFSSENPDSLILTLKDSQGNQHLVVIHKGMTAKAILLACLEITSPKVDNKKMVNLFIPKCHPNTIYPIVDSSIIKALINSYNTFAKNKYTIAESTKLLNQYQWLIDLAAMTDRSLPPLQADLAAMTDSVPVYRTQINPIPVYDSTRAIQTTIIEKKLNKKDTITNNYPIYPAIRIGTKVKFVLSAGIEVTTNTYYQKTASIVNSQLSVTNNANNVGYLVGLNYYPCGLFQIDNSFMGLTKKHLKNRLSVFAGLGLPNPLKDYYAGAGVDLVPGFKVIVGGHLFFNTHYQIISDQIAAQANSVKWAGPFISFNIDPSAFITVLGLFK